MVTMMVGYSRCKSRKLNRFGHPVVLKGWTLTNDGLGKRTDMQVLSMIHGIQAVCSL